MHPVDNKQRKPPINIIAGAANTYSSKAPIIGTISRNNKISRIAFGGRMMYGVM